MTASLNARSATHLRELGYVVDTTEHYNYFTKRRHDLFTIFDLVAISPRNEHGTRDMVFVQVTSRGNLSSRIKKIAEAAATGPIRETGGIIIAHGWDKYQGRWRLKEVDCS
jgi:hypothetical protein